MTLSDDPACNAIVEVVTAYLDEALPAPDRERFERHLAECEACAVYVEQMRRTIRLTGSLGGAPLQPKTRAAFVELLRRWKNSGGTLA